MTDQVMGGGIQTSRGLVEWLTRPVLRTPAALINRRMEATMNDPAVTSIPRRPLMRPRGMTLPELVAYETKYADKQPYGCWITTGTRSARGRYAVTGLRGENIRVHRAVLEVKIGRPLGALQALHTCNQTGCINPDHLYVGSNDENVRDRMKDHPVYCRHAKLSGAKAANIRERYATGGTSMRKLAAEHGVNPSTIRDLLRGKTWVQVN